ncbi:hypothetical protein Emag_001032 [Eimeria magna]
MTHLPFARGFYFVQAPVHAKIKDLTCRGFSIWVTSQPQSTPREGRPRANTFAASHPKHRTADCAFASAARPSSFSLWRWLGGSRFFGTKRQRLDEYDVYEATLDPRRVPADFGRVPIHLQSAGELKETIVTAGRLRLTNPNFWMRCGSAVRDLAGAFRMRELVAIVNAYAKAGFRDAALFDHLAQLLALQAHDGRASDLAVCLQAFARLGISNEALFDLLALQCMRKVADLGPRGIATVAAAYGGIGLASPRLFDKLSAQAQEQASAFCNVELTQLLWGCSRVGYGDVQLLNCLADQLMQRLSTCTELEVLTAAQAFATLGFHRTDLLDSLSAFFLRRIQGLPVRRLPMLLQTFVAFERLSGSVDCSAGGQRFVPHAASAALYRAVLPAVARQAACFSVSELAAVDSALRSVGLTHEMLTGALQQVLHQRAWQLSPEDCVGMLQEAAARGADPKDQAVVAATKILLGATQGLDCLSAPLLLRALEALKDLQHLQGLAVCASFIFNGQRATGSSTRLGGAELLVAQRVLLEAFPSKGTRRSQPEATTASILRTAVMRRSLRRFLGVHTSVLLGSAEAFVAACLEGPLLGFESAPPQPSAFHAETKPPSTTFCGSSDGAAHADATKAGALYASIGATASQASPDSLILAVCRYRGDRATWLWLQLIWEGKLADADPELLPALLGEVAHLQADRVQAEETGSEDHNGLLRHEEADFPCAFPRAFSAAELSRLFCQVSLHLMEGEVVDSSSFLSEAFLENQQEARTRRTEKPRPLERFCFSFISLTAAATAAKALRFHPNLKDARRYAEQLCLLVCRRMTNDKDATLPVEGLSKEGRCIERQQEAKALARLLHSLVAIEAPVPSNFLQLLAPRVCWLRGNDVLSVLRLLPSARLDAALRRQLARAVNLRFRDLRSWRRLCELRDACAALHLDVEDDIFQLETSQAAGSEVRNFVDMEFVASAKMKEVVPTIADAARGEDEEEESRYFD